MTNKDLTKGCNTETFLESLNGPAYIIAAAAFCTCFPPTSNGLCFLVNIQPRANATSVTLRDI